MLIYINPSFGQKNIVLTEIPQAWHSNEKGNTSNNSLFAVVMKNVICIAHHAIRFGMAHTPIKASNVCMCVPKDDNDDDVNQ